MVKVYITSSANILSGDANGSHVLFPILMSIIQGSNIPCVKSRSFKKFIYKFLKNIINLRYI